MIDKNNLAFYSGLSLRQYYCLVLTEDAALLIFREKKVSLTRLQLDAKQVDVCALKKFLGDSLPTLLRLDGNVTVAFSSLQGAA